MDPQKRTLRTKKVQNAYRETMVSGTHDKGCALCDKVALKTFTHWRIVKNDFPYDLIADVHDMIIPLRHTTDVGLSKEEWEELQVIKKAHLNETYQFIMEAMTWTQSIPAHFHLHLVLVKEGLN